MNAVDFFDKISIGSIVIQLFKQHHGAISSIGIRIGDFVYSNDASDFDAESAQYLHNISTWTLDCAGYISSKTHAGLDKVLQWYEKYKPHQILLTNMHHTIDYHEILTKLPKNIKPLYDGYKFTI